MTHVGRIPLSGNEENQPELHELKPNQGRVVQSPIKLTQG